MKVTKDDFVSLGVLNTLSGTRDKRKQCEWLAHNHIKFILDCNNRPRVHRRELDRVMLSAPPELRIVRSKPHFELINGKTTHK